MNIRRCRSRGNAGFVSQASWGFAGSTIVGVAVNASTQGHRTIAWADPEQGALVRAIGDAAGLHIVGAGTAARGRSAEVALALGASPIDDLRAALASATFEGDAGVDLVLIAAPHDFAADLSAAAEADREAVRTCRERGVMVASLEAMPASILAYARPTAGTPEVANDESAPAQDPHLRHLSRASARHADSASWRRVLEGFGPAKVLEGRGAVPAR